MIKKIITSGCSFSDAPFSWDKQLQEHCLSLEKNIEFSFLGLGSQGNELIQKKVSLEIYESLKKYNPDEIVVIVMWSGTERKTFYFNNPAEIDKLTKYWKKNNIYWGRQFFDLKNDVGENPKYYFNTTQNHGDYNPNEGWANFNFVYNSVGLSEEYFKSTSDNIHSVHVTLENIIMLQNLCKVKGIRFYQQFYRNYVYEDLLNNKDHQLNEYLYNFLDHSTIVLTTGMYEYLKNIYEPIEKNHRWSFLYSPHKKSEKYFIEGDHHPNEEGHKKWLNDILLPFLENNLKF